MTFFNSFFGMAYVMLMPIFAVDILEVGAKGQGLLLGMSGAGALVNTLYMGARGSVPNRGLAIIGGAVLFGLAVAAFALTAEYVGSLSLAMAIMFFIGIFNSVYMISIQSSLQMMVPDPIRGRVMGFYGMTWSIMPLGGMQASALTSVFTAPIAIAAGGLAVAIFALGPAMLNSTVRNLSSHLTPLSDEAVQEETPAPPFADDD
jgi:MFS family permease